MKILVVCLGNICRSPLGHGVLEHLVREQGLDWEIDSAGTGSWHIGEAPDRRSVAVAKKYGIDISGQRARQFNKADFSYYDRILVMDRNNLRDVLAMASTVEERGKVSLFLEDDVVPDPYFDHTLFDPVYQMIEQRCQELIQRLRAD